MPDRQKSLRRLLNEEFTRSEHRSGSTVQRTRGRCAHLPLLEMTTAVFHTTSLCASSRSRIGFTITWRDRAAAATAQHRTHCASPAKQKKRAAGDVDEERGARGEEQYSFACHVPLLRERFTQLSALAALDWLSESTPSGGRLEEIQAEKSDSQALV